MRCFLSLLFFCSFSIQLYAENRVALLIANNNYKSFSSLSGPINEAKALSLSLRTLGFDVTLLENGTREQMLDALDAIKELIAGKGGLALFHYGGHGVQAQGKNFLIPVDAEIPDERRLTTRAVDVDEVMTSLEICGSDANIVILDACRNNPLPAGASRSATRGLSVILTKPRNSIVVYSAEAGTVAQDGLFTPTLAKIILSKNISFSDVLLRVRNEVYLASRGAQIPGEYNQLLSGIYLNGSNINLSVDSPKFSIEKEQNDLIPELYPRQGLISEFLFNGTTNDSGAKVYPNNPYNIMYTDGKNGKAAMFDGTKRYIELHGDIAQVFANRNPYTVCVWTKWVRSERIICGTNGFHTTSFSLWGGPDFAVERGNANDGEAFRTARNYNDGAWYFVVCSYENGIVEMKVFSESKLVENNRYLSRIEQAYSSTDNGYLCISKFGKSQIGYYNGVIDQLRIYNRVLGEEEILMLWNNGNGIE